MKNATKIIIFPEREITRLSSYKTIFMILMTERNLQWFNKINANNVCIKKLAKWYLKFLSVCVEERKKERVTNTVHFF